MEKVLKLNYINLFCLLCFDHNSLSLHINLNGSTVFGLSVLGYGRNMALQHGGLRERGPVPSVGINFLFSGYCTRMKKHTHA